MLEMRWVYSRESSPYAVPLGSGAQQLFQRLQYRVKLENGEWSEWMDVKG